ncbi:MAG: hypothetical protein V1755_05415 [Chloroflexota bacterium]
MPILITEVLLLGTAAALATLRVARPRFRFSWLLALAATIAAWLSVWVWMPQLPLSFAAPLWRSASSPNSFASFTVSSVSWTYALCLVTLALAVLLTAPARSTGPNPSSWALCLTIVGLGLLAAAAEGPLTLVLFWAGLDLLEAGVVLARGENRSSDGQVPLAFAVRLGSMALVLLALVMHDSVEAGSGFNAIRGPVALLFPVAAMLRLTAFAVPWPRGSASVRLDEVGTTLHLVAGSSAIAFLSQLAPEAQSNRSALLVVCAGAALFGSWMWFRAPDRNSSRPLWVFTIGSLAVAAALLGNPVGASGWGSAMLLVGSALFLRTVRERWLDRALLLGLWISSAMPFALTSVAWLGGGGGPDWMVPGLLISQALLLAGLFHRVLRREIEPSPPIEMAWLRGIYRAGIALPLVLGLLLGIWGWSGAFQFGAPLAGAIVIPFAAAFAWAKWRFSFLSPVSTSWVPPAWQRASSGIRRELTRLHGGLQRAAETITLTIEGEAGIMWSLLLLVLFASLIASRDQ